jgi:hypothetical protein
VGSGHVRCVKKNCAPVSAQFFNESDQKLYKHELNKTDHSTG